MKKLTKCYIYTRVSTAIQVDGYSLEAQKEKLRKFAEYQGYEVAREYSDEGFSGKNIQGRLEFQRMLKDIQDGTDGVEYVLVFKLSRFGRNAADVLYSLQMMQDYGVNLICVEDGIDSSKDAGKLMISVLSAVAEIERENIRIIFDRFIHTTEGINGVANYLNNHGYKKKLRQNNTIEGFSTSFVKKVLDNSVYMGKIAYGRRKTEKKIGTRNEMHIVEQSEYPIYEGQHEAIISEEDWNLAQVKRKRLEREKIGKTGYVSILSTIVKCPCCGKSMYSNSKKPNKKDDKERFYYYCKNTRLEQQMDTLSVDDTHYDRKMSDYQRRYDEQYDIIEELEDSIDELEEQIRKTRQEQISGENVYELLKVFDELYYELEPVEKRDLMRALIERVELYPERQEDGRWVRSIVFQFPVPVGGQTVKELTLENETILETVVLMSRVSNEPR